VSPELHRTARQPSVGEASSFNYFIQPAPDQLLRVSVGLGFRREQKRGRIYFCLTSLHRAQ